jgi:hypothetical protein
VPICAPNEGLGSARSDGSLPAAFAGGGSTASSLRERPSGANWWGWQLPMLPTSRDLAVKVRLLGTLLCILAHEGAELGTPLGTAAGSVLCTRAAGSPSGVSTLGLGRQLDCLTLTTARRPRATTMRPSPARTEKARWAVPTATECVEASSTIVSSRSPGCRSPFRIWARSCAAMTS